MTRILIAIFVALVGLSSARADDTPHCRGNPTVVGKCITLRGRLHFSASGMILWHVGTKRLMNAGDGEEDLPASLSSLFSNHSAMNIVFGDFEVCPLEKERAGHMQSVCIESASHLFVTDKF